MHSLIDNAPRRSESRRPRRPTGFTLTELTIVLLVLSVAALVAQPAMEPIAPYGPESVAMEWRFAIEEARLEALRMSADHGVQAEPANKRIRVFRSDPDSPPTTPLFDVLHPLTKRPYDLRFGLTPSTAAVTATGTINWASTCDEPTLIVFDPDGTPRCGSPNSVLLESASFVFSQNGHSETLLVDGETGRVHSP